MKRVCRSGNIAVSSVNSFQDACISEEQWVNESISVKMLSLSCRRGMIRAASPSETQVKNYIRARAEEVR